MEPRRIFPENSVPEKAVLEAMLMSDACICHQGESSYCKIINERWNCYEILGQKFFVKMFPSNVLETEK